MSFKILHDHFGDTISVAWISASVTHWATTAVKILPHYHWHFPHSWITLCGAWRYHAIVEDLIVERVWPRWWTIFINGHRWIVGEVRIVQHLVHFISAHRQERCAHSSHVGQFNSTVGGKDFPLTRHFTCPFLLGELLTEAMSNVILFKR